MILEWAFGYAAGNAADGLLAFFRRDALAKALDDTLERWRKELPDENGLSAIEALFPVHLRDFQIGERTELLALRDQIKRNRLPPADVWERALFEQWKYVRQTVVEPQAFFEATEADAKEFISDLSNRLFETASVHANLFNPEVLRLLRSIERGLYDQLRSPLMSEEAARWINLVHEVHLSYLHAMNTGLPWPGDKWELVAEENRVYLLVYAFILNHRGILETASLDDFRDNRTNEVAQALVATVQEIEADNLKSG